MDKKNWEIKKLGDVCEILNGFSFKSSKYVDSGVRIIRITNVQKGYIIDNDPKYYSVENCLDLDQYMLRENDLLMSLTGNVGRVGLLGSAMLPAALNQRVACIRISYDKVNVRFLFHLFNSDKFELDCIASAKGIAQKNMSTEWLKKYEIPIPPISDQQHIVSELDLLSDILDKRRQQLKDLDLLAQSIFYDMFGDPVTNEKGWKTGLMIDVAPQRQYCGKILSKNSRYWILNLDMIEPNTGLIISKKYFTENEIGNSTVKFDSSNVLYSKLRPYLNKVVIPNEEGYATSELLALQPIPDILCRCFFAYFLRSSQFVSYINSKVTGAKMPRVSMDVFRKIKVPLPPLHLQQQFADKIQSIEKQKELIKQSIAETQQLFNSRMDYYFN